MRPDRWEDSARCRGLTLDDAEVLLVRYIARRTQALRDDYDALRKRLARQAGEPGLPGIGKPTPHPLWHLVYWNPDQQGYDDGYAAESVEHMAEWRTMLFFPSERSDGSKEALRYAAPAAVCAACPVRAECLDANVGELRGFYGGLSQERRRKLRNPQRIAS